SSDEHLAQCRLSCADILQSDRAHDLAIGSSHPEATSSRLVEFRNAREIRLIGFGDRDTKFSLLDRQDDVENSLLIRLGKWRNKNCLHWQLGPFQLAHPAHT